VRDYTKYYFLALSQVLPKFVCLDCHTCLIEKNMVETISAPKFVCVGHADA